MKIIIELTKEDLNEEGKKKHPLDLRYHDFFKKDGKLTMEHVNRSHKITYQSGQGVVTIKNR